MGLYDRPYQRDDDCQNARPNYMGFGGDQWRLWSMTLWIIVLTALGTLYQMATSGAKIVTIADNTNHLIFDSQSVASGKIWQLFTYPYFGMDILHVLFTLLLLFVAGRHLEPIWGRTRTLIVYLLFSAAAAAGATLYTKVASLGDAMSQYGGMAFSPGHVALFGPDMPVLALFLTACFRFPNDPVRLLFIPIDFKLKIFGWVITGFMALAIFLKSTHSFVAAGCLTAAFLGCILVTFPRLLGFADYFKTVTNYFQSLKIRYKENQRIKALKAEADLQTEVDRILVKVREHGLHSLTEPEKRSLKRATELQNKKPTRL